MSKNATSARKAAQSFKNAGARKTQHTPTRRTRQPKPVVEDPRDIATKQILGIIGNFDHHGQNGIMSQVLTQMEGARFNSMIETKETFKDHGEAYRNFMAMCQSFKPQHSTNGESNLSA